MKKANKKWIKLSIILAVAIVIIVLIVLIFNNLFGNKENSRYKDIKKYNLTNDEVNAVKGNINELGNVDSVSVNAKSKIIHIDITFSDNFDFEKVKQTLNDSLQYFKEENLGYYDVEVFVESLNEDSVPKIGYKHKTRDTFTW